MTEILTNLRKCQLTRSAIVAQLQKPNMAELLAGLYVRVLLELEGGGEEYKIARVVGVERGQEYAGFTYDTGLTTDKYLVLEMSPPAKTDNHYQLNSVSNKEFQQAEFGTWQRDVAANRILRPSDAEFVALQEKMRRLGGGGGGGSGGASVSNTAGGGGGGGGAGPVITGQQPASRVNNNATVRNPTAQQQQQPPQTAAEDDSGDSDYDQTEDEIMRLVEEEYRDKNFVVPNDLAGQTTGQLRLLEKDILEYLERLRENLDTHSTKCIACMVHDPAVIIMPCKHKVLCRGCCTKVLICPMCRVKIREVFEPVEM
eukprot:PhF_6_TR25337/c1_g1_i1/m.35035